MADTNDRDTGTASGWSIINARHNQQDRLSHGKHFASSGVMQFAVKGTANTTTNTPATGTPSISGTAQVGQTLTAGIGDIADAEDLPSTVFPAGYTFQWVRVDSSNTETDVGTDSSTYSPTSSDVGSTIKVKVSFTDGAWQRRDGDQRCDGGGGCGFVLRGAVVRDADGAEPQRRTSWLREQPVGQGMLEHLPSHGG